MGSWREKEMLYMSAAGR